MIDIISNWAGELIVSLIIVTIIEMLLPENKIKKYIKIVIGVYIIFCIISPFVDENEFTKIFEKAQKSLKDFEIEYEVSSQQYENSSVELLYIQEFEKEVIQRVEKLGYTVKKCEVDIEINATKDNAGINAIYLKVEKKNNQQNNTTIEIENVEKVEISINNEDIGNTNSEKETEETRKIKHVLSEYYEISEEKIKIVQN